MNKSSKSLSIAIGIIASALIENNKVATDRTSAFMVPLKCSSIGHGCCLTLKR